MSSPEYTLLRCNSSAHSDIEAGVMHISAQHTPKVQAPQQAYIWPSEYPSVRISRNERGTPRLSFIPGPNISLEDLDFENSKASSAAASIYSRDGEERSVKSSGRSRSPSPSPAYRIAAVEELTAFTDAHPLPVINEAGTWTRLRYLHLSYYVRLWLVVTTINLTAILVLASRLSSDFTSVSYGTAATAAGANLFAAAVARHEHFVNLLFRLATSLPLSTPLAIRRRAAKVYSYGGLHSGCGISALLWYILYGALSALQFDGSPGQRVALATTIAATFLLLVMMICTAHPRIRRIAHNQWEVTHRFGGWTAIALVWAQTLIIAVTNAHADGQSVGKTLATTPTFYFLSFITCLLAYPWLRMRERTVARAEKLSCHAVRLHFNDRELPSCVGYRLATRPLFENHGFATIPNSTPAHHSGKEKVIGDIEKGYSILVSNAGDWTSSLIANPPKRIWTRGAPTLGVMRIATLFYPIVIVATGSGIGPCLSFLQARPDWPVRVIWSARSPEHTYGREILEAVARADERAVVVDTKKIGHPDLVGLAWSRLQGDSSGGEGRGEAVVIISNPKVTRDVVFGLERRGVPAFGAIFDS